MKKTKRSAGVVGAKQVMSDYPVLSFDSAGEFHKWMAKNYDTSSGIWLKFYKKGSKVASVVYAEALDEALCYGWIDSQVKSYDEKAYLQKFTPRRSKSIWSKINREKVARLVKEGRMQPAGLAQVNAAKKDGRWDAAYDSPSNIQETEDFLRALKANKAAAAFYKTLNKANRYAVLWRIHTAKKAETRTKRIIELVAMLGRGEKIHPFLSKKQPIVKQAKQKSKK